MHTRFWKDSFIHSLSAGEKLLYNYLITNEKVNIIHCYELDIDEIVFDLGLSKGTIKEGLEKLAKMGKVLIYKDWVFLGNAHKYEQYRGELIEKAKKRLLQEMSKDVLDWYKRILFRGIKGVYIPPIIHKSKYIDNNRGVVKRGKKKLYGKLSTKLSTKVEGGVLDARDVL